MNFIETIFDSFTRGIKQLDGTYPYEIRSFCIGSGSNFTIHRHITHIMADKIYKEMKNHLPLGKLANKQESYPFITETWHTMESNSGYTTTFMFPINDVIEHNPNDVIDQWIEKDKKHKDFLESIKSLFFEERKNKHETKKNTTKQQN